MEEKKTNFVRDSQIETSEAGVPLNKCEARRVLRTYFVSINDPVGSLRPKQYGYRPIKSFDTVSIPLVYDP